MMDYYTKTVAVKLGLLQNVSAWIRLFFKPLKHYYKNE
jgi:hypothetical protein